MLAAKQDKLFDGFSFQTAVTDRLTMDRAGDIKRGLLLAAGTWAPLFRPEAFSALALAVAASSPHSAASELVVLASLGAWICGMDDLVDDPEVADADVSLRLTQYESIICGHACPELAFDPVASMLAGVLDALRTTPLGPQLWPLFTTQLLASCGAMRWERSAVNRSAHGERVAIDVYLHQGADSICVSPVLTAAAMLLGEPAVLDHVPALLVAQRRSALIIRIANDLATSQREIEEGSANALVLCGHECGPQLRVHAELERGALCNALLSIKSLVPRTAEFVHRFTSFFVGLYEKGDMTDLA